MACKKTRHFLRNMLILLRIAQQIKILIVALNCARDDSAHLDLTHKRYTAVAQAELIMRRRKNKLRVQPCLSDRALCRVLSPLLDHPDQTINGSIDTLSYLFEAQLRRDKVVGLPDFCFPLQCCEGHSRQAQAAARTFSYLREIEIISGLGTFDEETLHIAAQACGRLCSENHFELPIDLTDRQLPDLLVKLVSIDFGRRGCNVT